METEKFWLICVMLAVTLLSNDHKTWCLV